MDIATATEAGKLAKQIEDLTAVLERIDVAIAQANLVDVMRSSPPPEAHPTSTVLQVECFGQTATVIARGATVRDIDNHDYVCVKKGIIAPDKPSVTCPFSCVVTGAIPVPTEPLVIITPAAGWESASAISGVVGKPPPEGSIDLLPFGPADAATSAQAHQQTRDNYQAQLDAANAALAAL